jgi:SAM-dependent methyltransferase
MSCSFDNIANSYDKELRESLGLYGNRDISIFADYKIEIVESEISKMPVNILEFDCGTGRNSFFLKKRFPESNIFGCDISEKSIEIASKRNHAIQFKLILNPIDLISEYKDTFDCIFISNVFHHIPINEHQTWLDALYKITSKHGRIFIFEHNPYNPITKHIFYTSEIDKGAIMLTPSYCYRLCYNSNYANIYCKYTLFFLRRNAFFKFIERILYWLPFGAQYYIRGDK